MALGQAVRNVFPPDALDTKVGKLSRHVLRVDVNGADPLLAAVPADTGRADQVVRVGAGRVRVVGHAAHHHHGRAGVTHDLNPRERLALRGGVLALQSPRAAALALVPKSVCKIKCDELSYNSICRRVIRSFSPVYAVLSIWLWKFPTFT